MDANAILLALIMIGSFASSSASCAPPPKPTVTPAPHRTPKPAPVKPPAPVTPSPAPYHHPPKPAPTSPSPNPKPAHVPSPYKPKPPSASPSNPNKGPLPPPKFPPYPHHPPTTKHSPSAPAFPPKLPPYVPRQHQLLKDSVDLPSNLPNLQKTPGRELELLSGRDAVESSSGKELLIEDRDENLMTMKLRSCRVAGRTGILAGEPVLHDEPFPLSMGHNGPQKWTEAHHGQVYFEGDLTEGDFSEIHVSPIPK